jgi:hypothetical protein
MGCVFIASAGRALDRVNAPPLAYTTPLGLGTFFGVESPGSGNPRLGHTSPSGLSDGVSIIEKFELPRGSAIRPGSASIPQSLKRGNLKPILFRTDP